MRPSALLFLTASTISAMLTGTLMQPAEAMPAFVQEDLILNNEVVSSPEGYTVNGTMYLPVWYIMQLFSTLNIDTSWNGKIWSIQTPAYITPDLTSSAPKGNGSMSIRLNGVLLGRPSPLVLVPNRGALPTTYIPAAFITNIFDRLHLEQTWNKTSCIIDAASASNPKLTVTNTSGTTPGVSTFGNLRESWITVGNDSVKLKSLTYSSDKSSLPIEGTYGNFTGDLWVEISTTNRAWFYSMPCVKGHFAETVSVPFGGRVTVNVGPYSVDSSTKSIHMANNFAFTQIRNAEPDFSANQLALLQSWLINYNEDPRILQQAKAIVDPILENSGTSLETETDQEIKAVSDWVSMHIDYNWPLISQNKFVWQQASQTLQLRYGVCEDESALDAALLRSLGIPTQVVDGIGDVPNATGPHQWDESFDGTRWVVYDPTWDQVYYSYQTSSLEPPASTNDTYFDQTPSIFNQTHKNGAVVSW